MRRLIAFLLALPLLARAATGDITGCAVETNGWQLLVYFSGLATNQTFTLGWATNNPVTGAEKIVVNLTSQGYTDGLQTTTKLRTLYGTKQVRWPYSSNSYPDTVVIGSDLRVKIALSDFVYSGDSNITATIASGIYGSSLSGSGLTVTNLSTQPYPKVIGNWTWPGYRVITNTYLDLRAIAFHGSAEQGRPVRVVRFWATDEHSNTSEDWITTMTLDRSVGDAVPFGEYVANLDISGFTAGDTITANFAAFPWIGDTNSVLDTSKLGYTQPSANPAPLLNKLYSATTYGFTRAIVDTAGNDTTGVAAAEYFWATNTSPAPFATFGKAMAAIAATNGAVYSHNDMGGGIILVNAGDHAWLGSSVTLTGTQTAEILVMPAAGVATGDAKITSYSTDARAKDDSDILHVYRIKYDMAGTDAPHYRLHQLWNHECDITETHSAFMYGGTAASVWHLTGCTLRFMEQGLRFVAGTRQETGLVRGNTLDGWGDQITASTVVGNWHKAATNSYTQQLLTDWTEGTTPVTFYGAIWYNNLIHKVYYAGDILRLGYSFGVTNGLAFVQNVTEAWTNDTSTAGWGIGYRNAYHYTNLVIANNDLLGTKAFVGYNDSGSTPYYRTIWTVLGNLFDDYNAKTDDLTGAEDGGRTGNWPVVWGVGYWGNAFLETVNVGAPGAFLNEWHGIYSWGGTASSTTTNWPAFVDRQAHDGYNTMPGGGTYRLQSQSPLFTRQRTRWVLPYDIDGLPRGELDPPGAHASGQVRKGGFF